jgi:AcrR family transcriptional regulator
VAVAEDRERGGDFDARLVAAAQAVLEEHGLAGLTMARLAGQLGGSRMTLHRHGVTREDVVARLAALAAEEYRAAVWPALTSSASAADRLRRALEQTCDVADRYAKLLVGLFADDGGIFHDVDSAEPAELAGAVATRGAFVEPLARLLRDGAQDGTLRCEDPDLTATVLFNQVGWTYLALRHGQRWAAPAARTAVVDSAMASVAPPARAARRGSTASG